MTRLKPYIPAIILAAGALLRAATLGSSALWYDESVTLYRTSALPFMQTYLAEVDNSGCLLLELLLRPLMLLGHSLWLLRLPSLLAGFGCLWLVWKLMQSLQFSPRQQIFAAVFAAFLPAALWLGQDARVYGLLALVFLGGLWFAINGQMLGMTACLGLIIYCHNTGPAEAAAVLLVALYLRPWKGRRILISGALATLAWIPALVHVWQMSLRVFGIFQPWAKILTFNWFYNALIQSIWTTRNPVFVLGAFLLLLASVGLLYSRAWKCRPRNVLLIAWLAPMLGLILASEFFFNIVMYRTLMPMVFPLALFLGWEFGHAPNSVYRWVMAGLWTGLLIVGLALWRPGERGGYVDQAAAYIRSQWRTGDVLVYATQTVGLPFNFYLSDLPHYTWSYILNDPLMDEPGLPKINTGDPANARRVWLVFPHDGLITPAEHASLDAVYPHGASLWRITYLQAAPIDVYLEER